MKTHRARKSSSLNTKFKVDKHEVLNLVALGVSSLLLSASGSPPNSKRRLVPWRSSQALGKKPIAMTSHYLVGRSHEAIGNWVHNYQKLKGV